MRARMACFSIAFEGVISEYGIVPDSNTGVRLILKAFSDAEWVLLKGHREFMARIDSVKTIEEADALIREGAKIVEESG